MINLILYFCVDVFDGVGVGDIAIMINSTYASGKQQYMFCFTLLCSSDKNLVLKQGVLVRLLVIFPLIRYTTFYHNDKQKR